MTLPNETLTTERQDTMIRAHKTVQGVRVDLELDVTVEHPVVHITAPGTDWQMKFHCDECAKLWISLLNDAIARDLDIEQALEATHAVFEALSKKAADA